MVLIQIGFSWRFLSNRGELMGHKSSRIILEIQVSGLLFADKDSGEDFVETKWIILTLSLNSNNQTRKQENYIWINGISISFKPAHTTNYVRQSSILITSIYMSSVCNELKIEE